MSDDAPDPGSGDGVDPIDGDEQFREELEALLSAAEAGDVSRDAVAGLLTLYLARIRGDVRLPLGMEPDRARRFRERAAEHVGRTMELELQVSTEMLEEMALQLSAFDAGDDGIDDANVDADGDGA